MAEILGTSDQLQLTIPSVTDKNWAQSIRDACFAKIVSHDHTGSGKGVKLSAASLASDSIDDTLVRLRNVGSYAGAYLRGSNASNSGTINILDVNANNLVDLLNVETLQGVSATLTGVKSLSVQQLLNSNSVFLLTNVGPYPIGSSFTNQTFASNQIVFSQAHGFTTGQEVQVSAQTGSLPTGISASTTYYAIPVSSVILSLAANKADAVNGVASVTITSGAWTGLCTVTPSCFLQSANEMDLVFYKLVRGSLVECGFFLATQSNSYVLNQCMGNTVGVTFTVSGSVINYTADNSDVTTTISMNYLVIKL